MGSSGFCGVCNRTISSECDFLTCPNVQESPLEAVLEVLAETCPACGQLPPASRDLCPWLTCPHAFALSAAVSSAPKMTGEQFELFVRDRLLELGCDRVQTTVVTGDMGADLIAQKDGKTIVVQCKRYSGTVGIQAVQEVIGAKLFYAADEAWVVTDSTFTEAARKLARVAKVRLRRLVVKAR